MDTRSRKWPWPRVRRSRPWMRNWTKASANEDAEEGASDTGTVCNHTRPACRRGPLESSSRVLPKGGIGRAPSVQGDRSAAPWTAKPLRLSDLRLGGQEALFLPHG